MLPAGASLLLVLASCSTGQHGKHLHGALQGHGGIQMPYSDDRKWTVRQHLLDVVQVRTAGQWRRDLLSSGQVDLCGCTLCALRHGRPALPGAVCAVHQQPSSLRPANCLPPAVSPVICSYGLSTVTLLDMKLEHAQQQCRGRM